MELLIGSVGQYAYSLVSTARRRHTPEVQLPLGHGTNPGDLLDKRGDQGNRQLVDLV